MGSLLFIELWMIALQTLDAHFERLHMQFVSTKVQAFLKINVHKAGAKVVHVMESEVNFPRHVHCSDTACSLVLVYTHLGKIWTFGADKLCCGLLHAFEVNHMLYKTQLNIPH